MDEAGIAARLDQLDAENAIRVIAARHCFAIDVDVVRLYDAFTTNSVLSLEDRGFCAKGGSSPFVASGAMAPGGSLPVNAIGAWLTCVHLGMHGLVSRVEGVRQQRGDAPNLIPGAGVALVHTNGGTLSSQATAIPGRAA